MDNKLKHLYFVFNIYTFTLSDTNPGTISAAFLRTSLCSEWHHFLMELLHFTGGNERAVPYGASFARGPQVGLGRTF